MPVAIPVGAKPDEASFKALASQADQFFKATGKEVGEAFAKELADGLASGSKQTASAARSLANQFDRAADAAGRASVAQKKYNAELESGNPLKISNAFEAMQRTSRAADRQLRQLTADTQNFNQVAGQAGSSLRNGLQSGFSAGFGRSMVGRFMADFRSEGQSRGHAAGLIVGRAVGAGITAGLGAAAGSALTVVGGIGAVLQKGFTRLEGIDQAQFKLRALGHSGVEIGKIMSDANKSVLGTSFALNDAVGSAASAVAAGIQPGQDLANYLTTIGDASAVANTSFSEMSDIFNKVTASGHAYTAELNQLASRGIPIFTWLQQAYGVTGDQLSKMVRDGQVDSATFRNVIAQNIGGAAKEMGQSFSGAVENLGAALSRLGAAAIGAPFGEAADAVGFLTSKVDAMKAWMDANQDKVISFWQNVGQSAALAAEFTLNAVGSITKGLEVLSKAFGKTVGGMLKAYAGVQDIIGRHGAADAARQNAETFFAMGNGLGSFTDQAFKAAQGVEDLRKGIGRWGDTSRDTAQITKALGGAAATSANGEVTAELPTGPSTARTDLSRLGIDVRPGPGGKSVLVPTTDDARRMLDSFASRGQTGLGRPSTVSRSPMDVTGITEGAGGGAGGVSDGRGGASIPAFDESMYALPGGATGDSRVDSARMRVEQARLRLLELEAKGNASQSQLLAAKNNVLKAEQALRDAESKATDAHASTLQRQTSAMQKIGADIDQDFGISKGLPGLAENLTKFLANLAFAPAYGHLMATMAADTHPVGGVSAQMFAGGGMVGGGMYGGNVGAMMALAQSSSGRTAYGPASDLVHGLADCSGSISDLVEMLKTGQTTPGRLFTTTDFATDEQAAAQGFLPGYMPGALNVGVTPLPGSSGHMAATLPNGVNFEGGGGTGGGAQYGGSATGALDPQFSRRYYMPVGPTSGGMPGALGSSTITTGAVAPDVPFTPPTPVGGIGGGGMGVPGSMAAPPSALPGMGASPGQMILPGPSAPSALPPSVGAGGQGFQGLGGLPMEAAMDAAMALGPAGIAAQKGMQLADRAIGYVGQLAGIGVSGLLQTFLPHESPLADAGNSWIGRIASGFAGARPASKNMAGTAAAPKPATTTGEPGQGGAQTTNNITVNNNNATEDGNGKDIQFHLMNQNTRPGPRR